MLAIGIVGAHAQVITNPATPFTNSAAINSIVFNDGATHAGDVTNAAAGSINFLAPSAAISVTGGSIINGNIVNNGAVTGGVAAFGTVQWLNLNGGTVNGAAINTGTINLTAGSSANDTAILFTANGANLTGGFRNDGTINATGSSVLGPTFSFGMNGGVVNNGTMTFTGLGASSSVGAITLVTNLNTFTGGVTNNGTINVTGAHGPQFLTPILGGPAGITISAGLTGQPALPWNASITGGITNNGTMNVTGTTFGANGILINPLVAVVTNTLTIDKIANNGTMNISASTGANGMLIGNFLPISIGSVSNSGTMNVTSTDSAGVTTGIHVGQFTTITGSLNNSGTMNVTGPGGATAFEVLGAIQGSLVNSGTVNLTGSATVIAFNGAPQGALVNTGTINVTAGSTANSFAQLFIASSANLAGGFRNDGTIAMSGTSVLGPTFIFGMNGGIVNNGSMTFTGLGASSNVGGITLVANIGNFTGGITNNGTITVNGARGPQFLTPILGGPAAITISAGLTGQPALPWNASITGGITNNGTMNVTGTTSGANGILINPLVAVPTNTLTIDRIANNGTMNISASTGVNGMALGNFLPITIGSVSNSGTINATATAPGGSSFGILVGAQTAITGGITNTGIINALTAISTAADSAAITTNQNSGALNGAVALSGANADLFNVNAGLVNGQISGGAATTMNFNGGTVLAPVGLVDTIGTFHQTGGTLGINLTPNSALHGALNVAGTATLTGTLAAVVQPGLYGNSTTYTNVLTAGNPLVGTYAQTLAVAPGSLNPLLFFTATSVFHPNAVDIVLNRKAFTAAPGQTANQLAVSGGLEAGFSPSLTGVGASFYSTILQATSLGAFDALSGEGTSGTQTAAFLAANLFGQSMQQQADAWRNGDRNGLPAVQSSQYAREPAAKGPFAMFTKAPVALAPVWHAWFSGFGGSQNLNGNATIGSAALNDRSVGGALGADYQAAPDLLLGFGAGASTSRFDVDARATSGQLDGGHVGGYGMKTWGSTYLTGVTSYSHFTNSTNRTIAGVGPTEVATGGFDSDQLAARLEIGNTWRYGRFGVTPFAAVQVAELWQRGYSENSTVPGGGPGILGLSFAPTSTTSLPTFLGAQIDARDFLANGMWVSPFVRATWVHEFFPSRTVNPTFLSVPGSTFTVEGARAASDSARLDAGLRMAVSRNVSFIASFSGEFSNAGLIYGGTGALRVNW